MKALVITFISILFFSSCDKDKIGSGHDSGVRFTFSFNEREREIFINNDTDSIYLKGHYGIMYLEKGEYDQALQLLPELTTADESQYCLPDTLLMHFVGNYGQDSIKIRVYPERITRPVKLAFSIYPRMVRSYKHNLIDTTIIHLIPEESVQDNK